MKTAIREDQHLLFDCRKLYDVTLGNDEVEALVTHDPTMVKSWIVNTLCVNKNRLHRLIVGLDIEWSPECINGCDHSVATLQLCVGKSCLIYQILVATRIPQKLRAFLKNPDFIFVGVGIENDAQKLWSDYCLEVANTRDLRSWAAKELGRKELRSVGLKVLVKEILGEEINKRKSITCSRWDNHVLTESQVIYACGDAYFSFEIGRKIERLVLATQFINIEVVVFRLLQFNFHYD